MKKIILLGKFNPTSSSHQATLDAIEHSSHRLQIEIRTEWIAAECIDKPLLTTCSGLWIAPGGPHKDLEKALMAIQHCREMGVPCLGTCGGFQHLVLEYARNVLRFKDAHHAEYEPETPNPFITRLTCSLFGKELKIMLAHPSRVAALYEAHETIESYYCNFGINPDFSHLFSDGAVRAVGFDSDGGIRVVEITSHPFFIGTLFLPQCRSVMGNHHPLITGFVEQAAGA